MWHGMMRFQLTVCTWLIIVQKRYKRGALLLWRSAGFHFQKEANRAGIDGVMVVRSFEERIFDVFDAVVVFSSFG